MSENGWMCRSFEGSCSAVCFFFSSRRRHTRFDCDWSSDVCSSDLCCPSDLIECVDVWPISFPAPPQSTGKSEGQQRSWLSAFEEPARSDTQAMMPDRKSVV